VSEKEEVLYAHCLSVSYDLEHSNIFYLYKE
jgi:hypothetical protein